MSQHSPATSRLFLCLDEDSVQVRCDKQCMECREVQEQEEGGIPPEDESEDTNVEDSYGR